jgi:hypothetical protein
MNINFNLHQMTANKAHHIAVAPSLVVEKIHVLSMKYKGIMAIMPDNQIIMTFYIAGFADIVDHLPIRYLSDSYVPIPCCPVCSAMSSGTFRHYATVAIKDRYSPL